jgi:hypothetical protein
MGWKLTLAARFFHGMGLRETLGNKGFRKLSTLFGKFIFKLLAFFIGNLPAMFYLALVASKQGTPTTNNDNMTTMSKYTTNQLKSQLRNGEFAWPGGYPLFFITDDGATLSFEAVRENIKSVIWSIRHKVSDGWRVIGCEVNWEDDFMTCAHTGEPIESAYGEEVEA